MAAVAPSADYSAIEWSLPEYLAAAAGIGGAAALNQPPQGGAASSSVGLSSSLDPALALRIWTTALCAAAMASLDESWLVVSDGQQMQATVVDSARDYLAAQAAAQPRHVAVLIERAVHDAEVLTAFWRQRQLLAALDVREAERSAHAFAGRIALQYAGRLSRMVKVGHETFAVFFASAEDRFRRYQRVLLLMTLVLCGLAVEIWCESCSLLRHLSACVFVSLAGEVGGPTYRRLENLCQQAPA